MNKPLINLIWIAALMLSGCVKVGELRIMPEGASLRTLSGERCLALSQTISVGDKQRLIHDMGSTNMVETLRRIRLLGDPGTCGDEALASEEDVSSWKKGSKTELEPQKFEDVSIPMTPTP